MVERCWPLAAAVVLGGCTHNVKIEPIRVEPIFITLDVRLRVDRALDEFFDFQEPAAPEGAEPAADTGGAG